MGEGHSSFKLPAVPPRNSVEWSDCRRNRQNISQTGMIFHHRWHTDTIYEIDLVNAQEMGLTFYQQFSFSETFQQHAEHESSDTIRLSCLKNHQDVRASGDRLLDQDQQQNSVDLIRSCVNFILHSPICDELTK